MVRNSNFTENSAGNEYGAIKIYNTGNGYLSHCTFDKNQAPKGNWNTNTGYITPLICYIGSNSIIVFKCHQE